MKISMDAKELTNMIQERYKLALNRLEEAEKEHFEAEALEDYFHAAVRLLLQAEEVRGRVEAGRGREEPQEELFVLCRRLYEDLLPENYGMSYANPSYAVRRLGKPLGRLLCFLYFEMKGLAAFAWENNVRAMLIRMELFVEIYTEFLYEWSDGRKLPETEGLRRIIYWYAWDYSETAAEEFAESAALQERKARSAEAPGDSELDAVKYSGILYDGWLRKEEGAYCGPLGQCLCDHGQDRALVLDRVYVSRLLEVMRTALEKRGLKLRPVKEEREEESAGFCLQPDPCSLMMKPGQKQLWDKYCRKFREL